MTTENSPEIVRIAVPTPLPVGPANVILIKSDPPVLVDTGPNTDDAYDRLVNRLAEAGLALRDIGYVFLTHGHLDHAGLLTRIQHQTHAETCAHPIVAEQLAHYDQILENQCQFLNQVMPTLGMPPQAIATAIKYRHLVHHLGGEAQIERPLRDGETVAGLRAIFVPGHSPGDVLYYEPMRQIAITGDHIIKNMSPNPLFRQKQADQDMPLLLRYRQSLIKTRDMAIHTCYPGHGAPFHHHREIIDDILRRYDERLQQVLDVLTDEPQTPYVIMGRLFPSLSIGMVQFGISLVVTNLQILTMNGRARQELINGAAFFRKE